MEGCATHCGAASPARCNTLLAGLRRTRSRPAAHAGRRHADLSTISVIAWALILGLGLAGAVYAADTREPLALLGAAGIVNLLLGALALSERRALIWLACRCQRNREPDSPLMGLIWIWGRGCARARLHARPQMARAAAVLGILCRRRSVCFAFSASLAKDAAKGKDDCHDDAAGPIHGDRPARRHDRDDDRSRHRP